MRRMARMRARSRGTDPRTTKKTHPRPRSARACPSHAPQQPLHIKVLSDLRPVLFLISIDIKVFQTFSPHSLAAPILQILFILAILLQTKKARREK